jgi:hypothetical protein
LRPTLPALAALALVLIGAPVCAAERLVTEAYPGAPWKTVTDEVAGTQFLREQIPADQQLEGHRDILVAQAMPKAPPGVAPSDLMKRIFANAVGRCANVRVNGPTAVEEGGYSVAYGQVYCSQEIGAETGASMFFKLIDGDDAVYMINREARVPPSEVAGVRVFPKGHEAEAKAALDAQWTAANYLEKSVYLCGPRGTDKRCAKR